MKGLPIRELCITQQRKTRDSLYLLNPRELIANILIILGLSGIGLFGVQLARAESIVLPDYTQTAPIVIQPAEEPQPAELPRSTPTKLVVPNIGLAVDIKKVGKQADGSVETPDVLEYVTGWYKYSPTPGQLGPAVIVGHVDSYEGPSVFWNLNKLQIDNIIQVLREDGSIAIFKVDGVAQYEQGAFPVDRVYGNTNHAELRLITCGGSFDRNKGHYTHNTVVFATLVPPVKEADTSWTTPQSVQFVPIDLP